MLEGIERSLKKKIKYVTFLLWAAIGLAALLLYWALTPSGSTTPTNPLAAIVLPELVLVSLGIISAFLVFGREGLATDGDIVAHFPKELADEWVCEWSVFPEGEYRESHMTDRVRLFKTTDGRYFGRGFDNDTFGDYHILGYEAESTIVLNYRADGRSKHHVLGAVILSKPIGHEMRGRWIQYPTVQPTSPPQFLHGEVTMTRVTSEGHKVGEVGPSPSPELTPERGITVPAKKKNSQQPKRPRGDK